MKMLGNIFNNTQHHILNSEDKLEIEYDCYLSGGVVTLVVIKNNYLYCGNIGNISASLFFTEKTYSLKFKIIEIATDDSATAIDNKMLFNRQLGNEHLGSTESRLYINL